MSKITENAIKNAFKTLLDKKPLNQNIESIGTSTLLVVK